MRVHELHAFPAPLGSPWNPGPPELEGYEPPPERGRPAAPSVTVIGTVYDEAEPFARSWEIWRRQEYPGGWDVRFLILDDNGVRPLSPVPDDPRLSCWLLRGTDQPERTCCLAFNYAIRHLVETELVMVQWWDRIPTSFNHLCRLVEPHLQRGGIVTSCVSRHIGGSSSMQEMDAAALRSLLGLVPWRERPETLLRLCGAPGGHCTPQGATESSGFVVRRSELLALGGYDERYVARHGYPNVELWRRMLQAGLVAVFPDGVSNAHQSHGAGARDGKSLGYLSDLRVRRNQGWTWGRLQPHPEAAG